MTPIEDTVDIDVREDDDGDCLFIPKTALGVATLIDLITDIGGQATPESVGRGVEVSAGIVGLLVKNMSDAGIRAHYLCPACRAEP